MVWEIVVLGLENSYIGFRGLEFYFLGESNEVANFGAVYIHFDFEDYKGQFIGDITEDNLSLTRVLPMQYSEYVYTVN